MARNTQVYIISMYINNIILTSVIELSNAQAVIVHQTGPYLEKLINHCTACRFHKTQYGLVPTILLTCPLLVVTTMF